LPSLDRLSSQARRRGLKTHSMTERTDIFRPEALEHRARAEAAGNVVRIGPRWTTGAFWALIVLAVGAIVAASQIHVDRYARGATATDDAGRVVILVPAALAPEVASGRPVDLGGARAEVVSSGHSVLYPSEIEDRYGIDVAVPSIPVTTSARAGEETPGTARVLVESEPVIVALVPGLKALFGGDDG
jgi:hypothetical protein